MNGTPPEGRMRRLLLFKQQFDVLPASRGADWRVTELGRVFSADRDPVSQSDGRSFLVWATESAEDRWHGDADESEFLFVYSSRSEHLAADTVMKAAAATPDGYGRTVGDVALAASAETGAAVVGRERLGGRLCRVMAFTIPSKDRPEWVEERRQMLSETPGRWHRARFLLSELRGLLVNAVVLRSGRQRESA
ncbi:hypothetical protein SAMN05216371_0039 [Streptomyces sp. TLI_053]|uniref:hypothetical protein n=1 Tax=Streptomyces sp. TLI_053 TaxID=1855352 RepID=UPI00087B4FF8|nr:hypothetical protein [Streptomyces sp. TLI_053]SDS49526.1 hypothetical protein SAMN05216371_0039 [Streptomyces sp. TLI_053]